MGAVVTFKRCPGMLLPVRRYNPFGPSLRPQTRIKYSYARISVNREKITGTKCTRFVLPANRFSENVVSPVECRDGFVSRLENAPSGNGPNVRDCF